jgi:hypothetical protein
LDWLVGWFLPFQMNDCQTRLCCMLSFSRCIALLCLRWNRNQCSIGYTSGSPCLSM